MTVRSNGSSITIDARRRTQALLGVDPIYSAYNFEIVAKLSPKSHAKSCHHGQDLRRTGVVGKIRDVKRACWVGRTDFTDCDKDSDCDTYTCFGPGEGTSSCDTIYRGPGKTNPIDRNAQCVAAGGVCKVRQPGNCAEFPYEGRYRGNDGYRGDPPGDIGAKLIRAAGREIVWFDPPGITPFGMTAGTEANGTSKLDADASYRGNFLTFVYGLKNSCECKFDVIVDWAGDRDETKPGAQPGHRPGKTRLVPRKGTRCTFE